MCSFAFFLLSNLNFFIFYVIDLRQDFVVRLVDVFNFLVCTLLISSFALFWSFNLFDIMCYIVT